MIYVQDATEALDYEIDWGTELNGATIVSSTWVPDAGLTVVSSGNTTSKASVTVSVSVGAVIGNTYGVANEITDSQGRPQKQSLYINIEPK